MLMSPPPFTGLGSLLFAAFKAGVFKEGRGESASIDPERVARSPDQKEALAGVAILTNEKRMRPAKKTNRNLPYVARRRERTVPRALNFFISIRIPHSGVALRWFQ
jgi:hypothetical protein